MQRRSCREFECKFTSKMDSYSILSCFGKVFPAPVKGRHLGEKVRNKFYLALSIDLNTNGTVLDCSNERKSLNKYLSRICHRSLLLLSRVALHFYSKMWLHLHDYINGVTRPMQRGGKTGWGQKVWRGCVEIPKIRQLDDETENFRSSYAPCLVREIFWILVLCHFRCYLTINVQSWTN